MHSLSNLILNVVMAAMVLFAIRDIRTYSLKRQLATVIAVVIVMMILFNLPPMAKGIFSAALVIVTLRKLKSTDGTSPAPPCASPSITGTDDETTTAPLDELADEFNPDDITLSYAHPQTGVMHVDAALTAYTSHDEEAVKARARRIIIAHMTKTAAFSTGHDGLDRALREVVTCNEPGDLNTKLHAIPAQLTQAGAQSEYSKAITHKVITILDIVQVITEDTTAKSQLQQAADTLKQSE